MAVSGLVIAIASISGVLRNKITLPPFFGKKIYAIASIETAKMYGFPRQTAFPSDLTGGILAQTAFGPLVIGASVGDAGHRKWYFQLGRVF